MPQQSSGAAYSAAPRRWAINNSMIAGAGGGLVASIATCPLDVIKTKLQAQQAAHHATSYEGVIATIRTTWRQAGLRGFYRGLGPTILGYLPTWAIYFAVYDGVKSKFGDVPLGGSRPDTIYPAPQVKNYQPMMREHPWSLHILSAMTAGASSTICTNPLWVIKTRFQTQSFYEKRYMHTLDAFLTIYRTEGLKAFYRGLFTSLLGITHVAVQFPLYEELKALAQKSNPDEPLSSGTIVLCSGIAKMTASIATYPHEVVRTRLQTQRRYLRESVNSATTTSPVYRGLVQASKRILVEEGWRGMYKGLSINLIRTVPNSAVTLLTYEMIMRYLTSSGTPV